MNDPPAPSTPHAGASAASDAAPARVPVQLRPGDRLIASLWVAMAVVVLRALVQAAVDGWKSREDGTLLLEHFTEHLFDATSRAWLIVPVLTLLPRARGGWLLATRALVAAAIGVALLAGWPGGEPRYTPGVDTKYGALGWGAVAFGAAGLALFDRFMTSARRGFFRLSAPTRFLLTALVLLVAGGAIATTGEVLAWRRHFVSIDGIAADLYGRFAEARGTARTGLEPEVGSLIADVPEQDATGNKPSLRMGADAFVEYTLVIPPNASLSFSCGVDRASLPRTAAPGLELRFAVAIDDEELFSHEVRPLEREADRRWFDATLPLDDFAGRKARVRFATSGRGPGLAGLVLGFGRPLLLQTEQRARTLADAKHLNVVLVVVDALRRDHVHALGYPRETTPALDRLAQESATFESARATSSWSWPATASLLTGLWPPAHGVVDVNRCFLSDSILTLAEVMQAGGLTTLGATADPLITRADNFQQGFEVWREYPLADAGRVEDEFRAWVRRYRDYQFFAYVHFGDPARPFNPPPAFAERFARAEAAAAMRSAVNDVRFAANRGGAPVIAETRVAPAGLTERDWTDLYDAEVATVDDAIARMRHELEVTRVGAQSLWGRTIFVVVGACGETLGAVAPPAGSTLDDVLLDVPLLIRDPHRPASRCTELVDTTFLAATLLEAAGVPMLPGGPQPVALPPWGPAAGFSYAHTARGLLPEPAASGARHVGDLIALAKGEDRLVMAPDESFVEFRPGAKDASERDPEAHRPEETRRAELIRQLKGWYERLPKNASRPSDGDEETRNILDGPGGTGGGGR